jgi:hypothetical protein
MYPKQFSPRVDDDEDDDDELLIDLSARGPHTFDDDDVDTAGPLHDPLAPLRPTHARACGQRARPH